MDPITDVLTAVHVQSVCYGRLDATAPWGLKFKAAPHATFSMVSQGNGWLHVDGIEEGVPLAPGDFFLLAPGREFILRHDIRADVRDFDDSMREMVRNSIPFGGGGEPATLICGKFAFDAEHTRALSDLLPPIIHVPAHESRTSALTKTLELLAEETSATTPASRLVMNRLADILFIQAIRAHVASANQVKTPWLRAVADQQIGASLRSMHETLEGPWTVSTLASAAGMSRSGFARRFKELLDEGPLEYLTRWRMYQASELLRETSNKLVDVARSVGYESDGAFHKAFKRLFGVSPGEYRRHQHQRLETGEDLPIRRSINRPKLTWAHSGGHR